MSIATSLQSLYTKLNNILSSCNTSLSSKGLSTVSTLNDIPTAIDNIVVGIPPLITNDTSITPTGSYADSTYYDTTYGVKIGYMSNGDILLSMQGGTLATYEYLNFQLGTVPSGVTITESHNTSSSYASAKSGLIYACVIHGLTTKSTLSIAMDTRNSTGDYVTCTISIA